MNKDKDKVSTFVKQRYIVHAIFENEYCWNYKK